jgi:hypothetical protein
VLDRVCDARQLAVLTALITPIGLYSRPAGAFVDTYVCTYSVDDVLERSLSAEKPSLPGHDGGEGMTVVLSPSHSRNHCFG